MKTLVSSCVLALIAALPAAVCAQEQDADLTDEQILELYDGLRVADVTDGLDVVGLRGVGLMDRRIQAFWKDIDDFSHQFVGIALTVRYVPHNKVVPNPVPDDFSAWEGQWYNELSPEPFVDQIKPGTALVIDASGNGDTGTIGSYNSLQWYANGMRGIVTTGSARDTDEIIKQKIPLYMDPLERGRGIRPGRNMLESVNQPVEVGGVLVRPGDIVVADGDGVVVVPREYARPVAEAAHGILSSDKEGRRALYEQLGWDPDDTVQP